MSNPVTIVFGLEGMGIAPAMSSRKATGHHHLLINTDPATLDMEGGAARDLTRSCISRRPDPGDEGVARRDPYAAVAAGRLASCAPRSAGPERGGDDHGRVGIKAGWVEDPSCAGAGAGKAVMRCGSSERALAGVLRRMAGSRDAGKIAALRVVTRPPSGGGLRAGVHRAAGGFKTPPYPCDSPSFLIAVGPDRQVVRSVSRGGGGVDPEPRISILSPWAMRSRGATGRPPPAAPPPPPRPPRGKDRPGITTRWLSPSVSSPWVQDHSLKSPAITLVAPPSGRGAPPPPPPPLPPPGPPPVVQDDRGSPATAAAASRAATPDVPPPPEAAPPASRDRRAPRARLEARQGRRSVSRTGDALCA